jgi:beta-alanine--pyruvate transaminase
MDLSETPLDLSAYWMPFTANRDFKAAPRLLKSARGMYYEDVEGRKILDGTAGLWCVNAGHGVPRIVSAIQSMAAELDYAPSFQMGHPAAFQLASELVRFSKHRFEKVFYTNSGSESVDTALKIALAYHRVRGDAARTRLIGPRAWLPRRRFWWHFGGRYRQQSQVLRPAASRCRSPAAHP